MSDELVNAKALAASLRYSGDRPRTRSAIADPDMSLLRGHFSQSALRITREVTPQLYERLQLVFRRLDLPGEAVDAYVQSSPEIQAECFAGHRTQCVIRFSSALIDILDDEEFMFVVGHELGHFLLEHAGSDVGGQAGSIEYFMQQRSQEISVDRLGLIACGSLDIAVKALMKTISGLTSTHLRFDVGTFIAQLRQSQNDSLVDNRAATHPSILVRCRALLWFSLTSSFTSHRESTSPAELLQLNSRVEADFNRYVDGPVRMQIQTAKDTFAMWSTALAMTSDGIFTVSEQEQFSTMFGTETLTKLKNLLGDLARGEVGEALESRMQSARRELEVLIPERFQVEEGEIQAATLSTKYRADTLR
jgi:hypothetical protein